MKKIAWITADCFIDVDLPIVPILSNYYTISWFIGIAKSSTINHEKLIYNTIGNSPVKLNIVFFKNRIRNLIFALECLALILKIKREKADIYYVDMPGMPYFLPLFKLFIGTKHVIIATHNVSTPIGAANERMARLYMQFTLKAFANFHVFSKSQKELLELLYPNKNILLAPLALKDYGRSARSPNELITFLNFGIIRDYKRVDVLIEAANLAYEKTNKKFIVKIAGTCTNWDKYQSMIKYPFLFDLRIESIPDEEIADLFSSSHYFVLPYQDIAQSGAITVAFNYNLPVLASNLESFREFIKDKETGYLFEVASVNALADLLIYILENHMSLYPNLKEQQRKVIANRFNNEAIAKKYYNFFETIKK